MKKSNLPSDQRICSVARALDILGDRWIFLILREAFFGVRYYDEFLSNLGIATNILSDRLKRMVENNIMEKQKDSTDSRRMKYRLTDKGRDLYPVTLAFMQWGDRWLADENGPPLLLHHTLCDHPLTPVMCCAHCK
ncbi:MAG: helix-turn-helix domain-containing protein, partial [Desulfosalsimonadaceae bacterium]|nr:helix-turn-helix domain-containing protein [Desulfosalsimonadaceae bacterium]